MTESITNSRVFKGLAKFGLPRIIIAAFFLLLLFGTAVLDLGVTSALGNCISRWGMYGILALAMVPSVQCGVGLNFGISLGITTGLLGGLISIQLDIANNPALVAISPTFAVLAAFLAAILMACFFAAVLGYFYGLLLNQVKGSEMTVTTYIGFSMIAFMNIMWTVLPFKSGTLIYPNAGRGIRNQVSLDSSYKGAISNILKFKIGSMTVSTGLILFFLFMCLIVWLFMRSKTGLAMSAVGANPMFARAAGINTNKMRLIGTMLSTILAAVGIITYSQEYGFFQMYNAPLMMGFISAAAVLIGGASPKRATIFNVLLGTFLFQGIMALGLPVANQLFPGTSLSEILRMLISNGIILYALAQTKGGGSRE